MRLRSAKARAFARSAKAREGGIISPLLANIALDGLEKEIGVRYRLRKSATANSGYRLVLDDYVKKDEPPLRAFVRYADDFVVLCESEEDCHAVKAKLISSLANRGLNLAQAKTSITNIQNGFNFLGVTIRLFRCKINVKGSRGETFTGYKLIIRPSTQSLMKHRDRLKQIFVKHRGKTVDSLIDECNPVIRGWSNYHRKFCSRKTFEKVDAFLFTLQKRYAYRTHPNRSKSWRISRYFGSLKPSKPKDHWVFGNVETKKHMIKHRWISIQRHDIIPNAYSPDNPELRHYWRKRNQSGKNCNLVAHKAYALSVKQNHHCVWCFGPLYNYEPLEIHHICPRRLNGPDTQSNKIILHKVCHQALAKIDGLDTTINLLRLNLIQLRKDQSSSGSVTKHSSKFNA